MSNEKPMTTRHFYQNFNLKESFTKLKVIFESELENITFFFHLLEGQFFSSSNKLLLENWSYFRLANCSNRLKCFVHEMTQNQHHHQSNLYKGQQIHHPHNGETLARWWHHCHWCLIIIWDVFLLYPVEEKDLFHHYLSICLSSFPS